MTARRTSHLLFDFFGTLVDYSASRTEQGYHRTHGLLSRLGGDLSYVDFLAAWSRASAAFDRRSDADDSEFSMTEVASVFLTETLPRSPTSDEVAEFVASYVAEWNAGVRYLDGVPELLKDLSAHYRLAVVTNTHQPDLVPDHLAAMGVRELFEAVVTSVEVGWRKPHPRIFAATLRQLGIDAAAAAFVGDNHVPDYLGPERAGIASYLIDPTGSAPVADHCRLETIFDLPGRLQEPG
jgi:putative hydrolase of the HAD superfamily